MTQEEFYCNLLSRTAVVATRSYDSDHTEVIVPTRNKYIIQFFNGGDIAFQAYHEPSKTLQVYDILTNKTMKVKVMDLSISLYGLPPDIAPPAIANPMYFDTLSEKDLFDYHLPFLTQIKEMRDAGKLQSIINNDQKDITNKFLSFLLNTFNEFNYDLHTDNAVSNWCNIDVANFANENLHIMFAYDVLLCIDKDINIKNFSELSKIINDKERLTKLWKDYLLQKRDILIAEYEKEKVEVLSEVNSDKAVQELEKQFIEAQYINSIENLRNINFEENFNQFTDFGCIFYVPEEILPAAPEIAKETKFYISSFDVRLLSSLRQQGIIFNDDIIKKFIREFLLFKQSHLNFYDFVSHKFISQAKEIRYKQICEHAEKLAESIKQESVDFDEADLQEIISLVLDFDMFKQQLDGLETLRDVLQYWPAVLLPSPSFVTYL